MDSTWFCVCLLMFSICSINASPVQVNDFTRGISEFARDLYSQCVEMQPGNVIISPLSVGNALALLSHGSAGNTFEQLRHGLRLGSDKIVTAEQFSHQRETLEKNVGNATLAIANQIYVQQGEKLNDQFQNVAVTHFKSGIEVLNFADSSKSAQIINHFTEEHTNGKIKEIIKSNQLTADTRSVLVNAIYFKGNWERKFDKEKTHKAKFYMNETEHVPTDFMYMNAEFNMTFSNELDATALEMKYANSSFSLVFVLPNALNGLSDVESKLKNYDWSKITETMHPIEVDVTIPKFSVEYEIKLNDVLKNMGMTEIFSDNANLIELLESDARLKVSDTIHKAFIEVNEEGTEAAAATSFSVKMLSLPPQFEANHPFMYFIRDTKTNTVIFSGRIVKF